MMETNLQRHGLGSVGTSPMGTACFERPVKPLVKAAFSRQHENYENISVALLSGRPVSLGTGHCSTKLMWDEKTAEKYMMETLQEQISTVQVQPNVNLDDAPLFQALEEEYTGYNPADYPPATTSPFEAEYSPADDDAEPESSYGKSWYEPPSKRGSFI